MKENAARKVTGCAAISDSNDERSGTLESDNTNECAIDNMVVAWSR